MVTAVRAVLGGEIVHIEEHFLPVQAVSRGPKHHYFGYYDKLQFDLTGRYSLGLEVDFIDRPQTGDDVAVVGMVDLQNGNAWIPLAETRAWNWQQGCALQWLPGSETQFIYNDLQGDRFVSVIYDIETKQNRVLPMPVYHIAPNGKYAVTLNFARVCRMRPGYGYYGLPDVYKEDLAPAEDGIFILDIQTGDSKLIVSLKDIANYKPRCEMAGQEHWFNHLLCNENSSRFIFLHRWTKGKQWYTRMFTANADGSDIFLLNDDDMTSHFHWLGSTHVLAWAKRHDRGTHYYLFKDQTGEIEVVGEDVFKGDGHCSFSPVNENWILTDIYPDLEKHERRLILYHHPTSRRIDIGSFYSMRELDDSFSGELRCDLHPRWSRDGTKICFDSTHENCRQMYLVDMVEIVS